MFLRREAATRSSSSAVMSEAEAEADTTEAMGGAADAMPGEAVGGSDAEEDVPDVGSDTTTDAATGRLKVKGTEAEARGGTTSSADIASGSIAGRVRIVDDAADGKKNSEPTLKGVPMADPP
jgi:hypothetical protein